MKNKSIVTVLLVILILASCTPARATILPIEPSAPPVTFTIPAPTATTIPPTATEAPTEVPIPSFMDGFIAQGWDKQFENPDRGVTLCYIDPNSLRQTDFWVADVQILGVFDCYLIDDQGHLQQISVPLAWDKPSTEFHYGNWGNNRQKGDFSLGYMWNQANDTMKMRFDLGLYYFQFGFTNDFTDQEQEMQSYWQAAFEEVPYVGENFNLHGIVNLKDYPNAKHFMIPTHINFK